MKRRGTKLGGTQQLDVKIEVSKEKQTGSYLKGSATEGIVHQTCY